MSNITLPRAVVEQVRKALEAMQSYAAAERKGLRICDEAVITITAALAEQDAIARAVEAAVKECVTICEQQRVKILKNPADPSWTEHLAEVQSEMKQRFGVEMGYPALAEQEQKQKPATVELQKAYTDWSAAFAAADKAWKDAYEADKVRDAAAKRVSNLNATIRARGSK